MSRVAPGAYDLEVDDRSDLHNFHFSGPGGVDVSTEVDVLGPQILRLLRAAERGKLEPSSEPAERRFTMDV